MPSDRQWRRLIASLVVVDTVGVAAAVSLATVFLATFDPNALVAPHYLALVALVVPIAVLSFVGQRLYDPHSLLAGIREFVGVVKACGVGLVVLLAVSFLLGEQLPRRWVILAWLLTVVVVVVLRLIVRRIGQRLRGRGLLLQRALLVGANSHSMDIARRLSSSSSGIEIVGVLDDLLPPGTTLAGGLKVLGGSSELAAIAASTGASEAIVVPQALPWETLEDVLTEATSQPAGVRVELSAGYYDLLTAGVGMYQVNHVPLLQVSKVGLSPTEAFSKRALDCSIAVLLLVLLSPVLLIVVLRARRLGIASLKRQQAFGRRGRPFVLLRLAPEASRFVFIRNLPGLINVLRGELSVVGPRPAVVGNRSNGRSPAGIAVRPGLTGLWREADDPIEQALLDLYYIRTYSLWMDLHILFTRVRTRLWRAPPSTAAKEARAWLGSDNSEFGPALNGNEAAGERAPG